MGSTISPAFDTAPIDDVAEFLFTEGSNTPLPVARVILLTTAGLTQEDNILLPSKAMGVEIGMEITIIRQDMGDWEDQWQVALLPQPGDAMAGTAWAPNVAQWRLTKPGESVTFRALDGGAGTINWHPVLSDSKASVTVTFTGVTASGSGAAYVAIPYGIGSVRTINTGTATGSPLSAGTLTVTTSGLPSGNASGTVPTAVMDPTAFTGENNSTPWPPYVGDVEGLLEVRWAASASYAGPASITVMVELW